MVFLGLEMDTAFRCSQLLSVRKRAFVTVRLYLMLGRNEQYIYYHSVHLLVEHCPYILMDSDPTTAVSEAFLA